MRQAQLSPASHLQLLLSTCSICIEHSVLGWAKLHFPLRDDWDLCLCTYNANLSFDMHDNDLQIFPASKPKAAAKSRKKVPSDYNG